MDAVELPLPAVVPVPELLTSKGFGKAGVAAEKAEAREPDCVSILVSPSITGFSSSRSHKDVTCTVTAPGHISASMDNKADTELYRPGSQVPRFQGRNIAIHLSCRDANSSLFLLPKSADKQLHRKAGKESSNSPCSKRPRTAHVEDFISQPGVDERNVLSEKLGSSLTKCTFAEKSRVVKQKHSVDRKRGDRRNLKAPKKAKFESFFSEALTTNSAAGGNNILGIYGLKSAIHDVTKHVDELSLNELLDDNYKCPILCQEKGKKATNMNENIIHSVRMACSILQLQRPVHSQNAVHLDSSSNGKMPTCLLRSASCVISSTDCGKGDNYTTDLTSCRKIQDLCSKPNAPADTNNSLLLQPKDILERIALPPAKDLDSLLLDTAKHAVSSKNTLDIRPGKPISHGVRLPPFPWSYSFGGPCKTNIDSGKLSTNRSTCQGRWVSMGSIASSSGGAPSCFSDLDSLTFDHSLVPSRGLKLGHSENEKGPCTPVRLPRCEQASSSPGKTILKGSGTSGSHHYLELNLSQRCLDSSIVNIKPGFTEGIFLKVPESDLKYQENGTILMGPWANNNLPFQVNEDTYIDKEQSERRNPGGCTDSSCYPPFSCAVGGYDQLLRQGQFHSENSKQDGHSPRLLAAAQTLYEIASHSTKQNQNNGMIRWPQKPSQKAMKARKSRSSTGKAESLSATPKSEMGPGDPVKIAEQIIHSKKPKVSMTDRKKDLNDTNNGVRGTIKSSTPTSSRSSASKLVDTKQSNDSIIKLLGMMPSTTMLLDKACNSLQKPRKPWPMNWGRSKKE